MLKKQATSLSAHQNKLNTELDGLEEKFQKRKRDLEENSEKFNQEMKKLKEERPTFTEEKYREYARLWTDYIKQQFSDFKSGKEVSVETMDTDEKVSNEDVVPNEMEVNEPEKEVEEAVPSTTEANDDEKPVTPGSPPKDSNGNETVNDSEDAKAQET